MGDRGHEYPIGIVLLSAALWAALWQAWKMFR